MNLSNSDICILNKPRTSKAGKLLFVNAEEQGVFIAPFGKTQIDKKTYDERIKMFTIMGTEIIQVPTDNPVYIIGAYHGQFGYKFDLDTVFPDNVTEHSESFDNPYQLNYNVANRSKVPREIETGRLYTLSQYIRFRTKQAKKEKSSTNMEDIFDLCDDKLVNELILLYVLGVKTVNEDTIYVFNNSLVFFDYHLTSKSTECEHFPLTSDKFNIRELLKDFISDDVVEYVSKIKENITSLDVDMRNRWSTDIRLQKVEGMIEELREYEVPKFKPINDEDKRQYISQANVICPSGRSSKYLLALFEHNLVNGLPTEGAFIELASNCYLIPNNNGVNNLIRIRDICCKYVSSGNFKEIIHICMYANMISKSCGADRIAEYALCMYSYIKKLGNLSEFEPCEPSDEDDLFDKMKKTINKRNVKCIEYSIGYLNKHGHERCADNTYSKSVCSGHVFEEISKFFGNNITDVLCATYHSRKREGSSNVRRSGIVEVALLLITKKKELKRLDDIIYGTNVSPIKELKYEKVENQEKVDAFFNKKMDFGN